MVASQEHDVYRYKWTVKEGEWVIKKRLDIEKTANEQDFNLIKIIFNSLFIIGIFLTFCLLMYSSFVGEEILWTRLIVAGIGILGISIVVVVALLDWTKSAALFEISFSEELKSITIKHSFIANRKQIKIKKIDAIVLEPYQSFTEAKGYVSLHLDNGDRYPFIKPFTIDNSGVPLGEFDTFLKELSKRSNLYYINMYDEQQMEQLREQA